MSDHPTEIIIVKRKGGHGAAHHGGAWKIAFADFMTAMMAFFLVLWIINATDKDTKTVIARYFNPVKLENPARARKGVHGVGASKIVSNQSSGDQTPGVAPGSDTQPPSSADKDDNDAGSAAPPSVGPPPKKDEKPKTPAAAPHPEPPDAAEVKPKMTETALFSDPFKSLDKIAAARESNSPAVAPDTGAAEPMREAGSTSIEVFRDPFKPIGPGAVADPVTAQSDAPPPPAPYQKPDIEPQKAEILDASQTPHQPSSSPGLKNQPISTPLPTSTASPSPAANSNPGAPAENRAVKAEGAVKTPQQLALARDLQDKLGALEKSPASPAIDVRVTDEGLLISLTDRLSFSMFAVGSAEPRPELVRAMDGVGAVLKAHPGEIVLRGHTDARPYKSATYDNWRLSSARAQMASYMLVRAGIPEARIDRVEGHADHSLRDASHPLAAENRRIEILLRGNKS